MTNREAIELRDGLRSPFGRWLLAYLAEKARETKDAAIEFVPTNLAEMNDREQNFGRGKALAELVNQIPYTIDELIKTTQTE